MLKDDEQNLSAKSTENDLKKEKINQRIALVLIGEKKERQSVPSEIEQFRWGDDFQRWEEMIVKINQAEALMDEVDDAFWEEARIFSRQLLNDPKTEYVLVTAARYATKHEDKVLDESVNTVQRFLMKLKRLRAEQAAEQEWQRQKMEKRERLKSESRVTASAKAASLGWQIIDNDEKAKVRQSEMKTADEKKEAATVVTNSREKGGLWSRLFNKDKRKK